MNNLKENKTCWAETLRLMSTGRWRQITGIPTVVGDRYQPGTAGQEEAALSIAHFIDPEVRNTGRRRDADGGQLTVCAAAGEGVSCV